MFQRSSRRQQRQRQQRQQRGGNGSCSARFMNRQMFEQRRNQRGGFAPIGQSGLLLEEGARVQAEVAGLDRSISDSQMLVRQTGGRRRSRRQNQRRQSQRQRQRTQRRQRSRSYKQRGGVADYSASYMALPADMVKMAGLNPEFKDFSSTMPSFRESGGAQ